MAATALAYPTHAEARELFAHTELSLHRGPGEKFTVLTTVSRGSKFSVLWCNASADWCLVEEGLLQGWVPIDDIRARNTAAAASAAAVGSGQSAPAVAASASSGANAASAGAGGGLGASMSVTTPAASVSAAVR